MPAARSSAARLLAVAGQPPDRVGRELADERSPDEGHDDHGDGAQHRGDDEQTDRVIGIGMRDLRRRPRSTAAVITSAQSCNQPARRSIVTACFRLTPLRPSSDADKAMPSAGATGNRLPKPHMTSATRAVRRPTE